MSVPIIVIETYEAANLPMPGHMLFQMSGLFSFNARDNVKGVMKTRPATGHKIALLLT